LSGTETQRRKETCVSQEEPEVDGLFGLLGDPPQAVYVVVGLPWRGGRAKSCRSATGPTWWNRSRCDRFGPLAGQQAFPRQNSSLLSTRSTQANPTLFPGCAERARPVAARQNSPGRTGRAATGLARLRASRHSRDKTPHSSRPDRPRQAPPSSRGAPGAPVLSQRDRTHRSGGLRQRVAWRSSGLAGFWRHTCENPSILLAAFAIQSTPVPPNRFRVGPWCAGSILFSAGS